MSAVPPVPGADVPLRALDTAPAVPVRPFAPLAAGSAAEVRVALYGLLLALAAWGLLALNDVATTAPVLPWSVPPVATVLIVAGFALAYAKTLDIEIGGQTHSQMLACVPLMFALLLLAPAAAVAASAAGIGVGMGVDSVHNRRFSLLKLLWNMSLWAAVAASAALVIRTVVGADQPRGGYEWSVVLGALVMAELITLVAVPLVICAYDNRLRVDALRGLGPSQVITFMGACFALTALAAAFVEPFVLVYAAVPVMGVAGLLHLHGRLHNAHTTLGQLHNFTVALDAEGDVEVLVRLASVLNASGAGLVTVHQHGLDVVVVEGDQLHRRPPASLASVFQLDAVDTARVAPASHPQLAPLLDELEAVELLAMPLLAEHDRVGAIVAFGRAGLRTTFTEEEFALFHTLSKAFAGRVLNERLAKRDHLTGLPDREAFTEALDRAVELNEGGAVLQFDLVRFREINESLGHAVGDKVLIQVANRLCSVVRSTDLVARLGSDEFGVLISGVLEPDVLAYRVDTLRADLRTPILVDGISFDIGFRIGASRWPYDGQQGSQLLARAEIALTRAKQTDVDFVAFDESFDVATPRRLALAAELRSAIETGVIDVHLQPKVDLVTGEVVGAEALARWTHPEFGPVPPVEFIPLVEHAGLVGALTRLVLAKALDTVADLERLGMAVPVAVNLAARDLLDPSLPGAIDALLASRGLPGEILEVEITEGAMVVDFDTSVATLHALRARGIKVSVDDFGTGYSSLTYLHRLPVDCLKIDRSFIKELVVDGTAAAIVLSSIRLAHDLGLTVVAEGIEDHETLARLEVLGCDQAQGYLLARPMPAADLLLWMVDNRASALEGRASRPPTVPDGAVA